MWSRPIQAGTMAIGQAGSSSRPNQLGLRKWCSEPMRLEEPTWFGRLLGNLMIHLRGGIPGSTRYHFVRAEICGDDSGHHKGPPPGRDAGPLRKEGGWRQTAVEKEDAF